MQAETQTLDEQIKTIVKKEFDTLNACRKFETSKPEKILITIDDAAAALGISRSTLNTARAAGLVEFRTVLGKRVISQKDLQDFAMRLYAEGGAK